MNSAACPTVSPDVSPTPSVVYLDRRWHLAEAGTRESPDDVAGFKLPAIRKAKPYFFFLATLRVFLAVFFTADFAFLAVFFAFFAFLAMLPSVNEMALSLSCTRESKCTAFGLHQRDQKTSVPLKEVLTHAARYVSRADSENAARIACASAARGGCDRCPSLEIQKAFDRRALLASIERQRSDAEHVTCAPFARKNAPHGLRVGIFG